MIFPRQHGLNRPQREFSNLLLPNCPTSQHGSIAIEMLEPQQESSLVPIFLTLHILFDGSTNIIKKLDPVRGKPGALTSLTGDQIPWAELTRCLHLLPALMGGGMEARGVGAYERNLVGDHVLPQGQSLAMTWGTVRENIK